MKSNFIISTLGIVFCCSFFNSKPNHEKMAFKLLNSYSSFLEKKEGLKIYGIGGATSTDIKSIHASYRSREKVDIPTARRLFIQVAEGFFNVMNTDEKIRPFLHDYPFGPKNFELSISFRDKNDDYFEDGNIAFAMLIDDKISYAIYKKEPHTNPLKVCHTEDYETALKISREEN